LRIIAYLNIIKWSIADRLSRRVTIVQYSEQNDVKGIKEKSGGKKVNQF